MTPATRQRLLDLSHALSHPVTLWITLGVAAVLALTPVIILALDRGGRLGESLRSELWPVSYLDGADPDDAAPGPMWSSDDGGRRHRAVLALLF